MPDPILVFGNASANYPQGAISDWQTGVTMRRRPEQEGADVGTFGKEPRRFAMPAVLFGTTAAQIHTMLQRWQALKGQRGDLTRVDTNTEIWNGITLIDVFETAAMRRILAATNDANYEQVIMLVFARTNETS